MPEKQSLAHLSHSNLVCRQEALLLSLLEEEALGLLPCRTHEAARWILGKESCCQVTGRISASARKYWVFSCSQNTTHHMVSFWIGSCNSSLKSCIDFFWVWCHGKGKTWKNHEKTHSNNSKQCYTAEPTAPACFALRSKSAEGLSSRWIFARPTTRCFATYLATTETQDQNLQSCTGKSGSYQPSSAILSHHQPSSSAIPICVPARHCCTSDPKEDREELKRQQSQINTQYVRLSSSRRTSKFCNSCNSAAAQSLQLSYFTKPSVCSVAFEDANVQTRPSDLEPSSIRVKRRDCFPMALLYQILEVQQRSHGVQAVPTIYQQMMRGQRCILLSCFFPFSQVFSLSWIWYCLRNSTTMFLKRWTIKTVQYNGVTQTLKQVQKPEKGSTIKMTPLQQTKDKRRIRIPISSTTGFACKKPREICSQLSSI